MKFENWFRILWWALILVGLTSFVVVRGTLVLRGSTPTNFDVLVALIWGVFLVVPIFSEVTLGSLKLSQKIDEAKREIVGTVNSLTAEISNKQQQNMHVTLPGVSGLPSDEMMGAIRDLTKAVLEIRAVQKKEDAEDELPLGTVTNARVDSTLGDVSVDATATVTRPVIPPVTEEPSADDGADFEPVHSNLSAAQLSKFLNVRLKLESALHKQALRHGLGLTRMTSGEIINRLLVAGFLPEELATPIRVLYSICNAAIHGGHLTESQISFVEENQKDLITAVRELP